MLEPPPRTARLVLVRGDGEPLGALPPIPVATPWWPEAWPVVDAARASFGIDVVVLRLLAAERPVPVGGEVTYLVELAGDEELPPGLPLEPWTGDLSDHPLRQSWARRGGPDAHLAWARSALADAGVRLTGTPRQIRTWNLSTLWQLPVEGPAGAAWLKVVPPFFAHEGALLARIASDHVPRLLAHDGPRVVLAAIPGTDRYEATGAELVAMIDMLLAIQQPWTGQVDELLALGLPDWRAPALVASIAATLERTAGLSAEDRALLGRFVEGLPGRFARLAEAGVPDTLVHGDFHPGNVRGQAGADVLLDWGDAGVGHPMLDFSAFLDRIPPADLEPVRRHWLGRWQEAIGDVDVDVERAASLIAPIASARQATIYRRFLDGIEPSERIYHAADPADWLARTAALIRSGSDV